MTANPLIAIIQALFISPFRLTNQSRVYVYVYFRICLLFMLYARSDKQ